MLDNVSRAVRSVPTRLSVDITALAEPLDRLRTRVDIIQQRIRSVESELGSLEFLQGLKAVDIWPDFC